MQDNKEISALLNLIDDPDEEVYALVSDKLISFGKEIIPNLENLWEQTLNPGVQERIELMIHLLHFKDLTTDLQAWQASKGGLLEGALLVARYHYPDFDRLKVLQDIEKLRRNIWLELSNYLTALEQINVVNSILYNYYRQKGVEINYAQPEDFFINKALESKTGNAISNGILYLSLCEILDLPIKAINIPKQFLMGYIDVQHGIIHPQAHHAEKIKYFVDPLQGQVYSHKDVEAYFKRISVPPTTSYFKELNNSRVIQMLLEELSKCFDDDLNRYKMNELLQLAKMLDT
jgi:regulator of sirC expression with transglutaminase-like and TPR domain